MLLVHLYDRRRQRIRQHRRERNPLINWKIPQFILNEHTKVFYVV